MSKKRSIQNTIRRAKRVMAEAESVTKDVREIAPPRGPFSITILYDPASPQDENVSVMPVKGDRGRGASIEDVCAALRLAYEQALTQRGMWLAEMQRAQAAEAAAPEN